jgi:hypothetical protein
MSMRTTIVVTIAFAVLMIAMPIALTLTLVASLLLVVRMLVQWAVSFPRRLWRSRQTLPEGWWHEFEREFRAYSEPDLTRARQKERRL